MVIPSIHRRWTSGGSAVSPEEAVQACNVSEKPNHKTTIRYKAERDPTPLNIMWLGTIHSWVVVVAAESLSGPYKRDNSLSPGDSPCFLPVFSNILNSGLLT